jgi:hypothetical protein
MSVARDQQTPTTVVDEVISDLRSREAVGLKKYGVPLDRTDLSHRDWLHHAYEEALDFACYLQCAMRRKGGNASEPTPITTETLIAAIQAHHDNAWGSRTVLSPPDRALYDAAGINYEKLRPWQQGDVDYNEVRKRRRAGPIEKT